jgi:site-specific recombinase XerD
MLSPLKATSEKSATDCQELPENGGSLAQSGARNGARAVQSEARRTKRLMETLPKGITIGFRDDGRAKPFYVRHGADRKVQSFENESDRNDVAEKLADHRETEGSAILDFDPAEWRAYRKFRAECSAPFEELLRLWRGEAVKRDCLSVPEAVKKYLALRLSEDIREKSDTYRHLKKHLLQRFAVAFAERRLDEVTADDLRGWLDGLKNPKTGEPMVKVTKRHHRKDVNTFFKRAVLEGWITKNPCAAVKPPKIDEEEVSILTPAEIFRLLKANIDEPVVGRLALELYGGLRASSVERLTEEHIRWETKGIRMPGVLHKSQASKFRQGQPAVLWEWLEHAKPGCFEITASMYPHRKVQAFIRAGVTNTGNVLRHSFASYMLALTKSMPLVGYLMQHRHTSTTEGYEGIAEESDAKLVMSMSPQAVKKAANFEEFVRSVSTKPKPNQ